MGLVLGSYNLRKAQKIIYFASLAIHKHDSPLCDVDPKAQPAGFRNDLGLAKVTRGAAELVRADQIIHFILLLLLTYEKDV